jgi:DNA-directed RNA polymerase subunit RPC12/RpoP
MSEFCLKCGAQLAAPWRFCPSCGVAIAHESHQPQAPEHEASGIPAPASPAAPEKAPLQGAFSGLLFGALVAPMMIIVGTLLCLTGLGAFLGVPLIIGAVLAPLAGPMIGLGALKGKCPWCGTPVSSILNARGFDCNACNQRIAVQNRKFIKAAY